MRKLALAVAIVLLLAVSAVPFVQAQSSIADIASTNPDFSTLFAAVQAADPAVAEALSGPGPLTVFAPTNDAFTRFASFLGLENLDALLADQELLTQLLLYHVVSGNVFSPQVLELDGQVVPTLLEGTGVGIDVQDDGRILINNVAQVVQPFDVAASNGVIHAIDEVVFPGVLRDRLNALGGAAAEGEAGEGEEEVAAPAVNIRVAHFSPDTRGVDVYLNDEAALEGMLFGDFTDWITLEPGSYTVVVTPSGLEFSAEVLVQEASDNEIGVTEQVDNTIIGPLTLDLPDGAWVTIAAVGSRAEGTLAAEVIREDYSPMLNTESRVTVFHAIPDAPAVDVLAGGEPIVSGLSFGETATLTVPANTYDLAVVPSGATEPVVLDLSGTTLRSQNFYFVAAIGTLASPEAFVSTTFAPNVGIDPAVPEPPAEEEAAAEEAAAEETAAEEEAAAQTIAEIAIDNPNFSTLVAVVQAADPAVLEALSGEGPLTVFAPTNAAFDALFEAVGLSAEEVIALGGAELLTPVLLYHVIEGAVVAEDVLGLDGQEVLTLLGEPLAISITDSGPVLNENVNVVTTDIQASNGIIHVIDGVLLPQVTLDTLAELGIDLGGE